MNCFKKLRAVRTSTACQPRLRKFTCPVMPLLSDMKTVGTTLFRKISKECRDFRWPNATCNDCENQYTNFHFADSMMHFPLLVLLYFVGIYRFV